MKSELKFDLDENLEMLNREDLIGVIKWTLNDLDSWSNAQKATEQVAGFASMLYEAIEYQISKAVNRHNRSEEQ
jgi:hypothetical protein